MYQKADRLLFIALMLAILLHGSALLYNIDKTYDAFVHIFFADHYARWWFDPWEFRWYTGFTVTSYPPLSHQLIALLSFIGGLKFGFAVVILSALLFFVIGIYRFSQIWVSRRSAAYAAVFAVLASSIIQTIHIYGQLPTMVGISCLINALPEIYAYFRTSRRRHLLMALSLLGVTVASHHVTTIFGIVFFIAPVIATALLEETGTEGRFFDVARKVFLTALKKIRLFIIFFPLLIGEIVIIIFPYWYWSKTDPISQVPIPHGSRDSFINVPSSGLMFFIIPLGFTLLLLPYIFRSLYTRRNIFLALSFSILLLLGTGGTTPLPKMILGKNAFNILTLDRFTFWASVIAIPFAGDFFRRLVEGDIRERIIGRYGKKIYHAVSLLLFSVIAFQALFVVNFHKYRALQPAEIDPQPILNFLSRDQHDRWRFMTLGFGDQMAWLSSQTTAFSIDGNYHSARRVPEMTGQPLERLENSKFKGIPGLGSLQQFLTIPEKYYLKFIFSNDKFYDPILYFTGWERVQRLENGVMVWQKSDVPPLPAIPGRKYISHIQCMMWGIFPLAALTLMLLLLLCYRRAYLIFPFVEYVASGFKPHRGNRWLFTWMGFVLTITTVIWIRQTTLSYRKDPDMLIRAYYHALDFKYYQEAHSYFVPGRIDFDDYTLQLSVRDGLLASYGKLDSIAIAVSLKKTDSAIATVTTQWVTPLEEYTVHSSISLIKRSSGWYIIPPAFDRPITPDEHIEKGTVVFHSAGKRVISTGTVRHDDILDRPSLLILSSRLVKKDSQYVVVGEIMNTGYLPAHLTVEAQLYDAFQRKLVSYNARFNTIHNILPYEKAPFRIDFEKTAWVKEDDKQPLRFNPREFSAFNFDVAPVSFKVFARAVVCDKDLYRDEGVEQVKIDGGDRQLEGAVCNYGADEITVPQVLATYYDKDSTVAWVDHQFLQDGIRQQAAEHFQMPLIDAHAFTIVRKGTPDVFYTNGLQQEGGTSPPKTFSHRLIPLPGDHQFVDLKVNSYIGNPTVY
ncbi:MAG: hypothetical protein J0H74_24390 [Chitinophagaceae bacterium]|nr:hypothetical protein [Chitinophagaceae bacterium]